MTTAKKTPSPARKSAAAPVAPATAAATPAPAPAPVAAPATPKAPAPAAPPTRAKAVKPAKVAKPEKVKKPKTIRDSFTIPKTEYAVIDALKLRAAKAGAPAKKSELLRAGLKALAAMNEAAFLAAVKAVPAIKTGRPAKG